MPPSGLPCARCGKHCGSFAFSVGAGAPLRSLACLEARISDNELVASLPRCAHCRQPAPASPCVACAEALQLPATAPETVTCPGCGVDVVARPEGSCALCGVVTDVVAAADDALRASRAKISA